MGAWNGMLVLETIGKIRRAYFVQKKTIKAICRELRDFLVGKMLAGHLSRTICFEDRPGAFETCGGSRRNQRKRHVLANALPEGDGKDLRAREDPGDNATP